MGRLVTQPYDKITPEMQETYYGASPYNMVRLVKRKAEGGDTPSTVHQGAAETLRDWITQGILEQDDRPSFYPYFQEFQHPDSGCGLVRKGFIGLLRVEDYSAGIVHRHELTHSGPKLDRLELTRHTQAHFGQLFVLYDDPEATIDQRLDEAALASPAIRVEDEDGAVHRVWRISDPAVVTEIQASMRERKLLIADGHHRYETALAYARENPGLPGADRVMMTFVNLRAPGLIVLATHRVLDSLPAFDTVSFLRQASGYFTVRAFDDAETLRRCLQQASADDVAMGAVFAGDPKYYVLIGKNLDKEGEVLSNSGVNSLDVAVLHEVIIERLMGISKKDVSDLKHIRYIRSLQAALEEVRSNRAQIAFLLRPVEVDQIAKISFTGGVMPQKSTDFYPKLQAGLTIYRFG